MYSFTGVSLRPARLIEYVLPLFAAVADVVVVRQVVVSSCRVVEMKEEMLKDSQRRTQSPRPRITSQAGAVKLSVAMVDAKKKDMGRENARAQA